VVLVQVREYDRGQVRRRQTCAGKSEPGVKKLASGGSKGGSGCPSLTTVRVSLPTVKRWIT